MREFLGLMPNIETDTRTKLIRRYPLEHGRLLREDHEGPTGNPGGSGEGVDRQGEYCRD